MSARDSILELKQRVGRSIIGQEKVIDRLVMGLLVNGNLLLEGLPGLAKTRAVKALAKNLDAGLSRIQFTPDLLPSDVTGSEIYHQTESGGEFRFQEGPIFDNLILADEINRAPAKVQAALLEAMEERTVTVGGTSHALPPLFMVAATQNPIEQEGTYPLPEAQMDRFVMHVLIEYLDEEAETKVLRLVRGEEAGATSEDDAPIPQQAIFDARAELHAVNVADTAERYMIDLVFATRFPARYSDELGSWIEIGASPRGALGLDRCARAHAWMAGRDHVTPEDIRAVAHDVLRHRIKLSYEANAARRSPDDVLDALLELVAVP